MPQIQASAYLPIIWNKDGHSPVPSKPWAFSFQQLLPGAHRSMAHRGATAGELSFLNKAILLSLSHLNTTTLG